MRGYMRRYPMEKDSIQETLVIPLYGRALCSRKFPYLFTDQTAAELLYLGLTRVTLCTRIANLKGGAAQ